MLQAMLSGHSGGLSTVHAATPRDALVRLETLSLMSDIELPVYVARRKSPRPFTWSCKSRGFRKTAPAALRESPRSAACRPISNTSSPTCFLWK